MRRWRGLRCGATASQKPVVVRGNTQLGQSPNIDPGAEDALGMLCTSRIHEHRGFPDESPERQRDGPHFHRRPQRGDSFRVSDALQMLWHIGIGLPDLLGRLISLIDKKGSCASYRCRGAEISHQISSLIYSRPYLLLRPRSLTLGEGFIEEEEPFQFLHGVLGIRVCWGDVLCFFARRDRCRVAPCA